MSCIYNLDTLFPTQLGRNRI